MSYRESMPYDVVIVGAGPAGLSCAIKIKQQAPELTVCVLEKASQIGGHILSGATLDPSALNELIPDWKEKNAPLSTEVQQDEFFFLTPQKAFKTPHFLLPPCFKNKGNYIVRLGLLVQWLAQQAQALEVDIFEGFAATEILYDENNTVYGVATGDMGVLPDGSHSPAYQPGVELHAKWTIFAEGSRGSLSQQIITHYQLHQDRAAQNYALGIKEIWQVPENNIPVGHAIHSAGWPLKSDTYGGGFLYVPEKGLVALGIVVGLNYSNPNLSVFEEFQKLKTHPKYQSILKNGKRIAYGARTITAGGIHALPEFVFPGGALIGCAAGFLDASRIKGIHAGMYTGMFCANAIVSAHKKQLSSLDLYPVQFKNSKLYQELYQARNFKYWFKKGTLIGTLMTGIERWLLRGHFPWSPKCTEEDHTTLKPANQVQPIVYTHTHPDVQFDRLSSIFLSNIQHDPNQPSHLQMKDIEKTQSINHALYNSPETLYCPAQVYEWTEMNGKMGLKINPGNCLHCKTCDIKDPTQNITWHCPQAGDGPNYTGM